MICKVALYSININSYPRYLKSFVITCYISLFRVSYSLHTNKNDIQTAV